MKKIFLLIVIFTLNFDYNVLANENNCQNLRKFSVEYMKCKTNLIRKMTVSTSKKIIKDTKNYQKKEWTEEKDKVNKIKKKILEK